MPVQKPVREIRINPIVPSESVLIATARSMRPKKAEAPAPRDTRAHVETCPFCTGNEQMTPPVIAAYPAEKNWEIRIVENLYPVLGDDRSNPNLSFGLQQTIDGYGRHEVMIDHNQHGVAIHEMSEPHLALLFSVYRDRMEQLYRSNQRLRYVLVFKNFGPAAGASIAHTHSQVIAMPVIPDNVQAEVTNSRAFYHKNHHCIFCSLIDEALTFEATIYDRESGEIRRKINVGQYVIERVEKIHRHQTVRQPLRVGSAYSAAPAPERFPAHLEGGPGRPRARDAPHHGAARRRARRRAVQLLPAFAPA